MKINTKFPRIVALVAAFASAFLTAQGRTFPPSVKNIQDWMANSAVLLSTVERDGKCYCATGFFYRFFKKDDPTLAMLVIMTNRHVLENAVKVSFSVPLLEGGKRSPKLKHNFSLAGPRMRVEYHPDKDVDLCALRMEQDVGELKEKGTNLCYFAFDRSFLATDKDYEIERQLDPVVMVGHPNGLIDKATLQPIFRRGVYATRPIFDYDGKKEFVLDIPNFGGSSGSPVFHFDEGQFPDRKSPGAAICIGSRLTLVGVSHAGNVYSPKSCVFQNGTNRTDMSVVSGVFNNTAWVVKTSRIVELEDLMNQKYR